MNTPYDLPIVSLVIPCRNEEKTVGRVVESLLNQDYPKNRLELLFVDGMSTDRTTQVLERYRQMAGFEARNPHSLRVLANPDRATAAGFNVGIEAARGDVILTLGAHTEYSTNYVSGLVATMQETHADAVGSVARTLPGDNSTMGRTIAAAMSSRFGVGNSLMRVGVRAPQEADTASCPGYRRSVFAKVGRFNTKLVRNQDIEFNLRLRRAGGRIVLDPGITSFYHARSRLRDVAANNFQNGYWVVRAARTTHLPFSLRHLVPLGFVACLLATGILSAVWGPALLALLALVASYLGADVLFSCRAAAKHGTKPVTPFLIVFPALHLSYGLGSFWALMTLWRPTRNKEHKPRNAQHGLRHMET